LKVLKSMPQECIDLIYLDPPFFSKKNYDMPFNDKISVATFKDSTKAYEEMDVDTINKALNIKLIHTDNDFWKRNESGLLRYLAYMKDRLKECYRILKKTGSIYLHCDWHASHYLKIMMDEIFEYKNFRNEIIWHYKGRGMQKDRFQRKHDNLFLYSKSKKSTFNKEAMLVPLNPEHISRYNKKDEKGIYALIKNKKGDYSKIYLKKGIVMDDVWEIPFVHSKKEQLGYPTQKPEALLERIIKASSNEGDIVIDPFCGCGTTIDVATRLKRKFIGIDISHIACKVMKERLRKKNNINVPIIKTEYTIEDTNKMDWYEFQQWACGELLAVPGGKGADRGIDGEGEVKEKEKIIPFLVQSKKWKSNVGDDRVRAFKGSMDNKDTPYGIIIANNFSPQAIKQSEDFHENKKAVIHLITTEELLKKNFDVKKRTKWDIMAPDYVPWRKKDIELTKWTKGG